MEELSYVLTQYFVSCVHVRFYFHCRSFSPYWPLAFLIFSPPLWISMFFFLRNSPPLFSITRSSSFSVIHVKCNAEKDTTLLLSFISKSPGSHMISFQVKPTLGVQSRDYQIFSHGSDYPISLAMGLHYKRTPS